MSGASNAKKWRKLADSDLMPAGTLDDFPIFWRRLPGGPPWTYAWARDLLHWYTLERTTTPHVDHRKLARRASRYLAALRVSDELQAILLSVKDLAPTGGKHAAVTDWLATLPHKPRKRDLRLVTDLDLEPIREALDAGHYHRSSAAMIARLKSDPELARMALSVVALVPASGSAGLRANAVVDLLAAIPADR